MWSHHVIYYGFGLKNVAYDQYINYISLKALNIHILFEKKIVFLNWMSVW